MQESMSKYLRPTDQALDGLKWATLYFTCDPFQPTMFLRTVSTCVRAAIVFVSKVVVA